MSRPLVSPEGQSATFVELFFDLVFVFGLTQLVGLLHHDLSWAGTGRTVLVFWLVWWAWTQFTWALNAADTTHPLVELATLVATAIAFFMAVAVPGAFDDASRWFAMSYVALRSVGLLIYFRVASEHEGQRRAVQLFGGLSLLGLVSALAGGFAGGSTQVALWSLTIVFDIIASLAAGSSEWRLHAEHFAERHGLIVIIALGESLILAAGALATHFSAEVLVVAVLAVMITCGLWWTYFPLAKPELEEAMVATQGRDRSMLARDAFTLGHFPLLCGVIGYAVGLEDALGHPEEPLHTAARGAIALGLWLVIASTAFAQWRATCGTPVRRVVIASVACGAAFLLADVRPAVTLGIALVGIVLVAGLDEATAQRIAREA